MSKHSIRIGIDSMPSVRCSRSSASMRCDAAVLGAQPILVEREPRVALGQLEDAALVAALGVAHLHRRAARSLSASSSASRLRRAARGTITCGGIAGEVA